MSALIEEAVLPALRENDVHFFRSDEEHVVVIPKPTATGALLIHVWADDAAGEVILGAPLARVPDENRAAVLELLNDLHTAIKPFIRYSLVGSQANVQVGCELSCASNKPALVALALSRIWQAVDVAEARIQSAARSGYSAELSAVDEATRVLGEARSIPDA